MGSLPLKAGETVRTPSGVTCVRGDVGGRYAVERALGAGSMGIVYLAHDRLLERRVAIKVLRKHLSVDDVYVERMMREARAVAKIRSPHVAAVLDVGTLEGGTPYIVMEHLEGVDLADLLSIRGRLEPDEAIAIAMQACGALAEAHPMGIVHRDLKPENLFLARQSDGRVLVKVLDFGIAGDARRGSGALALTGPNMTLGSPNYMAPEQIEASPDLDARADLWALGAILYEAVAGRAPFEGDVTHEVFHRVLHEEPAPLRVVRPEVTVAFEAIVLRCLKKDPRARYAGIPHVCQALRALQPVAMDLLADDLRTGRASEPVVAPLPEPQESTTIELAAVRARPVLPATVATLFGAALAVAGWWSYESPWRASPPPAGVAPAAAPHVATAESSRRRAAPVVPDSVAPDSVASAVAPPASVTHQENPRAKTPPSRRAQARSSASSSVERPSTIRARPRVEWQRTVREVTTRRGPSVPRLEIERTERPVARHDVDILEFGGRK